MTAPIGVYRKDPDATLDYTIDWTRWLAGDSIVSSTWSVPSGMTQANAAYTTTSATIWLAGGTIGHIYNVTNQITTNFGRVEERTIRIRVEDR